MLREGVLETWRGFKKMLLDDKNLLGELSSNLDDMKFSNSGDGFGIKESSYRVMKELKRNLPSITQGCQELRNKYVSGQFGEKHLISDS